MKHLTLNQLLNLDMNKLKLYLVAWRLVEIGYYKPTDFVRFLNANGIKQL